jgi:type II secretory pathway pseudopilin PulG
MSRRKQRIVCDAPTHAFTVVELLVVIAVIVVLAGLIFPTFAAARKQARVASCTSQLRQIGAALAMYRQDYGTDPVWLSDVHPAYDRDARIYICPEDGNGAHIDPDGHLDRYRDPHLPCSCVYEFNPLPYPDDFPPDFADQPRSVSWRVLKTWELERYGDRTPIVRCWWHTSTPTYDGFILNLAYGGWVTRSPRKNPRWQ